MAIRYEKDPDNIVTLTLDMPGRPVNVINDEFMTAFVETLARLTAEEELTGVIITSAKKTFVAGGDLEWLFGVSNVETIFRQAEQLKAEFRRLETMGRPVVAAINGTALGGGMELALIAHYRIVLDHPRLKLGFPEVTLGLLPGGGGVTRLTRILGLQAAFPFLTEGKQVNPEEAMAAGIIHDTATDMEDAMAQAKAWILAHPTAAQPWDLPGYKMPGGSPKSPKMAQVLMMAPAMLNKRTRGNLPAPEAILNVMVEGAQVDFGTASRIESRHFANLATGQVAKNMIGAFWFQLNQINAGKSRPPDVPPQETSKVGVLGAGMMGHGIAYVSAYSGIDVVLKDVSQDKANAGKAKIEALADKGIARGRVSAAQKQEILDRIHTTESAQDLDGCDLIIEAVFEDRELKAQVTQEAEAQISETAVFASNTSTLPITGLAERATRPENFVGLHFFSPVHRMKLVEIIRGAKTSDVTLAKAFDYVLQIRKIPIVVNDSRGFYTSRVFATYVKEGLALLGEGQHPYAIESAGLQAGMPVGPLALADEVSLSLMLHIREQTRKDLAAEGKEAPYHPSDDVLDVMTEKFGRFGKARGAGFYEYPTDAKKYLWPELTVIFPLQGEKLSQTEMIARLMFVQALETARCYEEEVVTSVADANIGSIFAWGFAPFKVGTLQYINDYGMADFVSRSHEMAERSGERFAPPDILIKMADKQETFAVR